MGSGCRVNRFTVFKHFVIDQKRSYPLKFTEKLTFLYTKCNKNYSNHKMEMIHFGFVYLGMFGYSITVYYANDSDLSNSFVVFCSNGLCG